ncbi:MAG TPA: cytochrome c oxidase subunit II [Verrucomicrobiae bacterium]|jgi:cytochrome c oxidase subunit 2
MITQAASDLVLSPASPEAKALADLFVVTLIVCAVIFAIVAGLTAWCALKFRHRGQPGEPPQVAGNKKLEISWTLASVVALIFLFVLTVQAMRISDPPSERTPDITVIGHQWWWEARYAGGAVAANEIHIPAKTDVLVKVDSADVIHAFWVPQLGRKMDAIPGHPNRLWIRADQPGEYTGACSVFCGAQHAWMRLLVVAESQEEFAEWSARQTPAAKTPATPEAARGRQVFLARTCVKCHFIRGVDAEVQAGPDLTHFASRQSIGTGVVTNDATHLRLWLADPQQIKPACLMPDFHLSIGEVGDLASYLETLK